MQTVVSIAHQTDTAPKPAATETKTIPSPIPVLPTETPAPTPIPVLPTETQLPTPTAEPPQPASGVLHFHFVNVGQGDSTVIQAPDGKIMLIDGGDPNTGIVQYLQNMGVQRIDLMVATHPHADHIGGLVQVLHHSLSQR
ncbi:MAG: MBL fold metallo-hydrolase [Chloroflexi bacterium]|nr:MBL fold metallo-hydrolase [Chloroflexota bacterium]